MRWVETFYSNVSSCIINNGSFSGNFELSRGVRQGDPLWPYLFVIAIETLAAAIRTSIDIKGIKLDLEEWKLVQYADDLTLFLSDLTSAMWIGSCRDSPDRPLSLKWCKSVKALGVHYSCNKEVSFQKNFYDKITEIKKQIHQWSWRGLSLFGKVSITKNLFFLNWYIYSLFSHLPRNLYY